MIDVIVPIYRGLNEVQLCLNSVIDNAQTTAFELIIINDKSPEPAVTSWLKVFVQAHEHVSLLENEENLGFVATVNRGMSLHPDRDVVLLNSDTEVANDWLDRLEQCANSASEIGTVTPFSNNATICSFPIFCESNNLPAQWPVAAIDKVFAQVNQGQLVDIPTAVGFCMYIKRECLQQVGVFDEASFGKGYGEENDFCQRAIYNGWRNVLCCDTFVFHEGGVSFSTEQAERVANAQKILDKLYPEYHQQIQQHIQADPAAIYRLSALVELYHQSPRTKVLFVTHHLGGGTASHMAELADYLVDKMDVLVVRPGESGTISLSFGAESTAFKVQLPMPKAYPLLKKLMQYIGVAKLHFHHTLGIETSIWGLPNALGVPYDITLHDYYFINANPTQTDAKGRYRDTLEGQESSYPLPVSVEQWQENQNALLSGATHVIAPSHFTQKIYQQHFPDLAYKVAYHPDWEDDAPYPDPVALPLLENEPLRIVALGALGLEKGADLLEQTAVWAKNNNQNMEFHLVGYAYRPLDKAVIEHGAYKVSDLDALFEDIKPHLVWFPAMWPETYSYTLSEILKKALPVIVPNIGSFPERVKGRALSWIADWDTPADGWIRLFGQAATSFNPQQALSESWLQSVDDSPGFYDKTYLDGLATVDNAKLSNDKEWLNELLRFTRQETTAQVQRGKKERLLKWLFVLRQSAVGRLVSRLIPYKIQRAVKRKLSRRPMHEIQ